MRDFEKALAAAFGTGSAEPPGLAIDRLDGSIVSAPVRLCRPHPAGPVRGSVSPCLTGVNLCAAPAAG
ncbi:hypothetical protein ACWEGE_06605 [Amycolatopsis sp. NPDC004747]